MAWAKVGTTNKGTVQSATASTTLTFYPGSCSAGTVCVLTVAKSNAATSSGQTNEVTSVTDAAGNTWVKAREYTYSGGSAGSGATVAVYYSKLTAALDGTTLITINFSSSTVCKAAMMWNFTVGAGNSISVVANATDVARASELTSQSISGLASGEYLFWKGTAAKQASFNFTPTSGFTAAGTNYATGTNPAQVGGEFLIQTGTGATSNCFVGAVPVTGVFLALKEGPASYSMPVTTGSFTVTGRAATLSPASPVRYIRDQLGGSFANNGNPSSYWVEIQAFTAAGTNVALGKTVTIVNDAGLNAGSLSMITDGDTDTNNYVTISGNTNDIAQVQVDLGATYQISKIVLTHYNGDGRIFSNSKTQVSVGGSTWVTTFDSAVSGTYSEQSSGRSDIAPYGTSSGKSMAVSTGTFALTGNAVSYKRAYTCAVTTRTYALTGRAPTLRYGRVWKNASGTFVATFNAVGLYRGDTMVVSPRGIYTLTGSDAELIAPRRLISFAGLFGLTGSPAALAHGRTMWLTAGTFSSTGNAAVMTKGGGVGTSPLRYIRETMNGATNGNPTSYWVEIKALDGNGVNVAQGKTVTPILGTVGEGSLPMLVDGDIDTNSYVSLTGSGPMTMQIDLGAVYNIASITRWHYYGDSRTFKDVKVEVSVDGVTWVTIFDTAVSGQYAETSAGKTNYAPFGTSGNLVINAVKAAYTVTGNVAQLVYSGNPAVTYVEDTTTDFPNPERGFLHSVEINGSSSALAASLFSSYMTETPPKTLARFLIYLNQFVSTATLPTSFLNVIRTTLANMRSVGFKCIPRFSYEQSDTGVDATKAIVLGHIDQLVPILTEYSDVIAWMEMGFVGSWGEWAHSNNFGSVNNNGPTQGLTTTQWADRRQVVERVLSQTPSSFMVCIRTPMFKKNMYGNTPLADSERFNGTYRARIGHHNDAFVSTATDMGTYYDQSDWDFVAQETKWMPWTGETDYYPPRTDNAGSIAEMQRVHTCSLNTDYHASVINQWKSDGTYNTMSRLMGYRLFLESSSMPTGTAPGRTIPVTFKIINRGFAAPHQNRPIKLVFKSASNTYIVDVPGIDMREWLPGGTYTVSAAVDLPVMAIGTYDAYLYIPDSAATLNGKVRTCVRLATQGTWNEATGYNSLNRSLAIANAAGVSMPVTPGVFALTGNAAGLPADRKLSVVKRSFVFTGYATSGYRNVILHAAHAAYLLLPSAASVKMTRRVAVVSRAFTLTGYPTDRQSAIKLQPDTGVFRASMFNVTLTGPVDTRENSDQLFFRWTGRR